MMNTCPKRLLLVVIWLMGMWCAATWAADAPQGESLSDALSDRIVSATQGWGELGLDTSAHQEGQQALKLRIKDKEYAHGLGHHANGEIVVELGGQFQTFQTEIGVQWQGGATPASVVFQIYVDDKKVFDSGVVRENDPPRPVSVSVEGADELRLVANDAGDGISFDCADWADARLIRNPAAAKERSESAIDIAPFARVASWDPKVMTGTKANRVQEFPAEDIAPYKEILPATNGTYTVPATDDTGCIGLQWDENRMLRRVLLQFPDAAAVPPAESVQLQYWTGASAWQGQWQPADLTPKKVENSLVWSFGFKQMPRGTQKVRWVFSDAKQPIALKGISAFARSRWKTVDVRILSTHPGSTAKAEIEVYNGVLLNPTEKSPHHCTWDTVETALPEGALQRPPALQGRSDRVAVPPAGHGLRRGDRGLAGQRLRVRASRRRVRHAAARAGHACRLPQEDRRAEDGARASPRSSPTRISPAHGRWFTIRSRTSAR